MTTSLSKSTIPTYDPDDTYTSPRIAPRVRPEARVNYENSRGSLNIGDWSAQSGDWQSPRPPPKVKFEEAQKALVRDREGSMKEIMGGYCDPPLEHKGPRVRKEAQANFLKNKGTFDNIIANYGQDVPKEHFYPRVNFEGRSNNDKGRGTMGSLLGNYGNHPLSAKPVSRVKYEGNEILSKNRGAGVGKTLLSMPPSSRPSSSQFFTNSLW